MLQSLTTIEERANTVNRLKSVRERKGLTRNELALALEVVPLTIEKWEEGRLEIDLSSLTILVRVLNCRVSEILPEVSSVAKVDIHSCQFGQPKLGEGDIRKIRSSPEFRNEFNVRKYSFLVNLLDLQKRTVKKS